MGIIKLGTDGELVIGNESYQFGLYRNDLPLLMELISLVIEWVKTSLENRYS